MKKSGALPACLLTVAAIAWMSSVGSTRCHAGLVLEFGQGSTVGTTEFSIMPGGSISLNVYLTQTDGETRLSDSNTSVNAYEFDLSLVDVSSSATSSGVGFLSSVTYGPFFVTSNATSLGSSAGNVAGESSKSPVGIEVPGVTVSDDGVSDDSVLLATIQIQATTSASGTYQITAVGVTDIFGSRFTSPDTPFAGFPVTGGTVDLNVTAVPEPSFLAVFGIASVAGLRGFKSKRLSKKPVSPMHC